MKHECRNYPCHCLEEVRPFQAGDLVEYHKGEALVRGRLVRYGSSSLYLADFPNIPFVDKADRQGWLVILIEAVKPPEPVFIVNRWYVDKAGDMWYSEGVTIEYMRLLTVKGGVYSYKEGTFSGNGHTPKRAIGYGPFTEVAFKSVATVK